MRISDLLHADAIDLSGSYTTKSQVIDRMVELMVRSGNIINSEHYKKCVLRREKQTTTGIGEGIAIPHAKSSCVLRAGLAAMVIPKGVDFNALDGEPVTLAFMIAAPHTKENIHLDVLSHLSYLIVDEDLSNKLRQAADACEFLRIIEDAEYECENIFKKSMVS